MKKIVMACCVGLMLAGCETTGGGRLDPVMAAATKENPYVNSLGMKFVPVPGTRVLMQTTEVTVDQWSAFGRGYNAPAFPQGGDHPAVNVSWGEAKAYCAWLSAKEGKKYRLPTDHEWSCAVGIGHLENPAASPESKDGKIAEVYPWGSGKPSGRAGNYMGQEWNNAAGVAAFKRAFPHLTSGGILISEYNDGHLFTAPVGSYAGNSLGIYDLGGNVWEWCEDRYNSSSPLRVLRGGSWNANYRELLRSSFRLGGTPGNRSGRVGFRVVLAGSGG